MIAANTLSLISAAIFANSFIPRLEMKKPRRFRLQDTFFTQPSIFVIEYALARFWQSLGIEPATMAGHSIGEFVAATLAGVWELEDALGIIALRGRLMQNLPRGSMMAVNASADADRENSSRHASDRVQQRSCPLCRVRAGSDVVEFQKQLEAKEHRLPPSAYVSCLPLRHDGSHG